jgi:hypothetical protein
MIPEGALIPRELRAQERWICWRWDKDAKGNPTKAPTNPHGDGRANASTTAPATWSTYEHAAARAALWNLPGVGFVFTGSDLAAVDLDHVRDAQTGETEPWALDVIRQLDSYTELSQSGTGYHIIARGQLPPGGRKRGPVEMYDASSPRYFVTTGLHVPGTPETVNERTAQLAAVHARYFPPRDQKPAAARNSQAPLKADDGELLILARNADNSAKFCSLYDAGDWSAYPSQSEADLALCSLLAFYTGDDPARSDRLFRQSALYRDKWDVRRGALTYGESTIARALEGRTEYYTPGQSRTPREPDWLTDAPQPEGVAAAPPTASIRTWSLAELLSTQFPEPAWIVPDRLPAGLALLAGRPKQGKSFLALQLGLALGAGGRFLDVDLAQGRCLYVALEDSPTRLQRRLEGMAAEAIGGLDFAFTWPALNEPAGIDALAAAIRDGGLRLVVIDTLARAIRGRLDWDDVAQVTAMLGQLQALALASECCILLIDHHRKGNGQGGADAVDDVMGSTGKSAVADTVWGLYRKRGERTATLAITGRDVEEDTLALSFDHRMLTWQMDVDQSGVKLQTVQGRVYQLIEDWGTATTTELAEALGLDKGNVSKELSELLARGVIVKGKRTKAGLPYSPSHTPDKLPLSGTVSQHTQPIQHSQHSQQARCGVVSVVTVSVGAGTTTGGAQAPTEIIMRELELSGAHSAEYLAANLHLSRDLVDGALEVLADSGEITARGDRWAVRA